jgi:hypothetical protein
VERAKRQANQTIISHALEVWREANKTGQSLYNKLPAASKRAIESRSHEGEIPLAISVALSGVSNSSREKLDMMLDMILELMEENPSDHLSEETIVIIKGILMMQSNLQKRSNNNLVEFFRRFANGDDMYLIVQGKGKSTEVRTSYQLDQACKDALELK